MRAQSQTLSWWMLEDRRRRPRAARIEARKILCALGLAGILGLTLALGQAPAASTHSPASGEAMVYYEGAGWIWDEHRTQAMGTGTQFGSARPLGQLAWDSE